MPRQPRLLDRQLNSEERQYLRDLRNHKGYQIMAQLASELMVQALEDLLSSDSPQEISRMQGRYLAIKEVLNLPSKYNEAPAGSPFNQGQV
jgi:GTP cyclohydrolase II